MPSQLLEPIVGDKGDHFGCRRDASRIFSFRCWAGSSLLIIIGLVAVVVLQRKPQEDPIMSSEQSHTQLSSTARDRQPAVSLSCGVALAGSMLATHFDRDVAAFRAIPYALPPVNERRWLPPVALECPARPGTTLDVSQPGGACWQNDLNTGGRVNVSQSEDCLTLDVYTQASLLPTQQSNAGRNGSAPVLVWLYGGSLVHGSTRSYPGIEGLAARGELVLVAMNYRLAAFGFLTLPELDAGDPRGVSANRGILDIQEALRWIQRNAAAFGGDAARTTLLGQSSGGTAILGLLASPASRGLFAGAISLSASPNLTIALDDAQVAFRPPVLAACGLPDDAVGDAVMRCLERLSPQEVATLLPPAFNVEPDLPIAPSGQGYPGLPVVDGVTVAMPVLEALRRGFVDVPLLLQTMLAEMDTYQGNATIYGMNTEEYSGLLEQRLSLGGWSAPSAGAEVVTRLYAEEAQNSTELLHHVFLADYSFLCGHIRLAAAAAASFAAPVYLAVTVTGPAAPMAVMHGQAPCRHAGHNWDYISATRAWDFWYQHFPPTRAYAASEADERTGDALWEQWHSLLQTGQLDTAAFRPAGSDAGTYTANLFSSSGLATSPNYARSRCAALEAQPLGLDQRFWLVN